MILKLFVAEWFQISAF